MSTKDNNKFQPGEEQDSIAPFVLFAGVVLILVMICRGLGLL